MHSYFSFPPTDTFLLSYFTPDLEILLLYQGSQTKTSPYKKKKKKKLCGFRDFDKVTHKRAVAESEKL